MYRTRIKLCLLTNSQSKNFLSPETECAVTAQFKTPFQPRPSNWALSLIHLCIFSTVLLRVGAQKILFYLKWSEEKASGGYIQSRSSEVSPVWDPCNFKLILPPCVNQDCPRYFHLVWKSLKVEFRIKKLDAILDIGDGPWKIN